MIFKRRDKRSILKKIRDFAIPKKGWFRVFEYFVHRIRRIPDTAHKISLGLVCGIFASFLPAFGFHFFISGFLAYLLKGNILAALLGTFFGNPISFPIIAGVSINLGQYILGRNSTDLQSLSFSWVSFKASLSLQNINWYFFREFLDDIVFPYLLGGVIIGLATSITCYFVLKPLIRAYQLNRRKKKLLKLSKEKKFL